jgi:hypothetical protein
MCTWIVTLPQGFSRDREFFETAYDFLSERYGDKNVISAYVHMDENQPHIHFSFVPVVTDKKNGKEKVSAKELLTKVELQRFHPALQAALEASLGQEVPVLNGATAGGNRTVAELKAEQEILIAEAAAEEAKKMAQEVKEEVTALQNQKKTLQSDVKSLQAKILTEQEVIALKGRKTLTGALKGVSYEDYESLRKTARQVKKVEVEKNKAIKRAESAERRAAVAEEKAKNTLQEKPSLKMQTENAELKGRLSRIENWLTRLLNFIPEQFRIFINNILRDRDPFKQEQQYKRDRDR